MACSNCRRLTFGTLGDACCSADYRVLCQTLQPHLPLSSHRFSFWPPCGIVLIDGMHYLSPVPALLFASFDSSEYLVKNGCAPLAISYFESLEPSHLMLCLPCSSLWAKHGSLSSGFLHIIIICGILIGWNCLGDWQPRALCCLWLAEIVWVIGSQEPSVAYDWPKLFGWLAAKSCPGPAYDWL